MTLKYPNGWYGRTQVNSPLPLPKGLYLRLRLVLSLRVKGGMSRICPAYAPHMSRIFKEAGHIWSIYGGNAGDSAPGPVSLKALQAFKQKGFIAANVFVLTSARWPNERIGHLSSKTQRKYSYQ